MRRIDEALPHGTEIAARFRLNQCLGLGAGGFTYAATDLVLNQLCIVKEMAPAGFVRGEDLVWTSPRIDEAVRKAAQRHFVRDAKLSGKLGFAGVKALSGIEYAFGTVFAGFADASSTVSVAEFVNTYGTISPLRFQRWTVEILSLLAVAHDHRLLHRRLHPGNVRVTESESLVLVDFGGWRDWYERMASIEPESSLAVYLAPEQLRTDSPRLAGTDLYAATLVLAYALWGPQGPGWALQAAATGNWDSLPNGDVFGPLARCLDPQPYRRPISARSLLQVVERKRGDDSAIEAFRHVDQAFARLIRHKPLKMACPACGGVLEHPKPIRPHACPVCRDGAVTVRKLSSGLCPCCKVGALRTIRTKNAIQCPHCDGGFLIRVRSRLWKMHPKYKCDVCGKESPKPDRASTERSNKKAVRCDTCGARFIESPGGTRRLVASSASNPRILPKEIWARIAIGLDEEAGNATCTRCHADYELIGETMTLLGVPDTQRRVTAFEYGRTPMSLSAWRHIGADLRTEEGGLICADCGTEFSDAKDGRQLIATREEHLRPHTGETHSTTSWRSIAAGLGADSTEEQVRAAWIEAARTAYRSGELLTQGNERTKVWWSRSAAPIPSASAQLGKRAGVLTVGPLGASFSRRHERKDWPWHRINAWCIEDQLLLIQLQGEDSWLGWGLKQQEFRVEAQAELLTLVLDDEDLKACLMATQGRKLRPEPESIMNS